MSGVNTKVRTLTLAIISGQHLLGLGLQKIFQSWETVRIVVQLHPAMVSDVVLAEGCPDVFILDLETEQDSVGAIKQIKESAPKSKIVL